jgi:hypothetical protein
VPHNNSRQLGALRDLPAQGFDVLAAVLFRADCRILLAPQHSRHRAAATDPGPLIGRNSLDIRSVNSSILEGNRLRIGEVFELL